MVEVGQLPLVLQVALPLGVTDAVDGLLRVDDGRGHGEEGLGARVDGEALLDHLGDGHWGVEEGLQHDK